MVINVELWTKIEKPYEVENDKNSTIDDKTFETPWEQDSKQIRNWAVKKT